MYFSHYVIINIIIDIILFFLFFFITIIINYYHLEMFRKPVNDAWRAFFSDLARTIECRTVVGIARTILVILFLTSRPFLRVPPLPHPRPVEVSPARSVEIFHTQVLLSFFFLAAPDGSAK